MKKTKLNVVLYENKDSSSMEGPWHASTPKYLLYLRPFSCLSKWLQWPLNTQQERFILNFILRQKTCFLIQKPKLWKTMHKAGKMRKSKLILEKKVLTHSFQKHICGWFSKILLWVGFFKSQQILCELNSLELLGWLLESKIKYTSLLQYFRIYYTLAKVTGQRTTNNSAIKVAKK